MCGRYTITKPKRVLAVFAPHGVSTDLSLPRYNIAPMQQVPVVTSQGGERILGNCQWGFVPEWARDSSIGSRMINARVETVAVKPAFRQAFRTGRCLIPADGFYEWRTSEAGKQPFLIRTVDSEPFAFAGLCSSWNDVSTGQRLNSCTILTRAADSFMAPVHDRMPVILPDVFWNAWLERSQNADVLIQQILAAAVAKPLVMARVSKLVNSPANDSEDCIAPAGDQSLSENLLVP